MSKRMWALAAVALMCAFVGYSAIAYGAEGCCAAKSDAGTCPAAKSGSCPAGGSCAKSGSCPAGGDCAKSCAVTATGTVDVKTEGSAKTASLKVSDAKADDGKTCCAAMKGKEIKLSGEKAAEAEKLAGKQVEVKGTCKAGKELEVASVTEKK